MTVQILIGDVRDKLRELSDESVHCVVTSPPYFGLRDYGHEGQIGLEDSPQAFVATMVEVFAEVRRVLRSDGTCWLNMGDSYAGSWGAQGRPQGSGEMNGRSVASARQIEAHPRFEGKTGTIGREWGCKPKDLIGIPWMLAFALRADGWWLRQDIIWAKPNPMPESVRDRCTKSHEYIFLLAKSERYYYDADAIKYESDRAGEKAGTGPKSLSRGSAKGQGVEASGNAKEGGFVISPERANKRSVWSVPTAPYAEAHFATFPPALIEPCILAGCPPAGKRCDCDHIIETPTGDGEREPDPSAVVGRAGMSRPRRPNEGTRPITRREQRWHATQMRESPHRSEMELMGGPAFAHYIRTDESGARPLPEALRLDFTARGWITEAPPCECPIEPAGTVLDPFGGAGTTGLVADRLQRNAILIELNPEYADMAERRIRGDSPLFAQVS